MNWMGIASKAMGAMGKGVEQSAEAQGNQAPPTSPTMGFVEAARAASLERQQAQAAQVQMAPTATAGGAMLQTGASVPVAGQNVPVPTMQNQGTLSLPPGGMISQGQADPAVLAEMYRMRGGY